MRVVICSGVLYLIKQIYSTHACWISAYDSRLGAPHFVHYTKAHIQARRIIAKHHILSSCHPIIIYILFCRRNFGLHAPN